MGNLEILIIFCRLCIQYENLLWVKIKDQNLFCPYFHGQKNKYIVHSVRGQNVFFNLVVTEINEHVRFDLMLYVCEDIWLLTFRFNFGLIGWPPQPPREMVSKIDMYNSGFWMIHSTLRDQDRSFWCQDWWNHQAY